MKEVSLIQKESKNLKITLRNKKTKEPIDVAISTITLYCKNTLDDSTNYQFTVLDANIDKSEAVNGVIRIPLSSSNLDFYGIKYAILKIEINANNIDKSVFTLNVTNSPE